MKISNFNKKITSRSLNESLKKKFGYSLNLNVSLVKAKTMLATVNESLATFKKKVGTKANTNSSFMEKKLVAEALKMYVAEKEHTVKLDRRAARLKNKLNEAQQQEAEVVMAAKDMVDRIQGMIEDLGEMENEQLIPLVDSVRVSLGNETASSFEMSMIDVLASAMDAMRQARIGADSASRVLSGDETAVDDFMGMDGVDGDEMGMEPGMDVDVDIDRELDVDPMMAPDMPDMGRETRDAELDLSNL